MSAFINRFLAMILLVTSVAITLILVVLGYQVAILLSESGSLSGLAAKIALAGLPSLFALGALPFWLVLRRFAARGQTE